MSDALLNMRARFLSGVEELGHSWGWYLAAGIALIILGLIAISDVVVATVLSVIIFGWILLAAGITLIVLSALTGRWSGFLVSLAAGLLSGITGILLLRAPLSGAATLTLVIAAYFAFTGIFRVLSSLVMHFPNWGWSLASGIVSIILAGILFAQWPQISLWFLGFYVGVDLIVHGFSWCMFALSVHNISRGIEPEERMPRAA